MEKTIPLFLILLVTGLVTDAQTLSWAKTMGGSGTDKGRCIVADASGNVFVTGSFQETVDFDPNADATILTSNFMYSADIFLQKLDEEGNLLWAKNIGRNTKDDSRCTVNSMTVDTHGNVYTTGSFEGTVDFDPSPDSVNLSAVQFSATFVQKLDVEGNLLWIKSMGADGEYYSRCSGHSITVDDNENVFTAGNYTGKVDFNPNDGTTYLTTTNLSNHRGFIQKLDIDGNLLWVKKQPSTFSAAVAVDPLGNVHLTEGGFMQKLDMDGNIIWQKTSDATIKSITLDNAGNIYTTGYFSGTVDFDPNENIVNLTSISSRADVFIQKLDSKGSLQWAKSIGGDNNDVGNSISVNSSGDVYIAGLFSKTVDFDPNEGISNLSAQWEGIFILKLDSEGNLLWVKTIADPVTTRQGSERWGSMTIDLSDNVYTTGYFSGTVDFDPNANTTYLSAHLDDIFIQKLNAENPLRIETLQQSKIKLYPNPTNHILNIELPTTAQTAQFSIINYMGQMVHQGSLNSAKKVVDVSHLSVGIYQVNVILNTGEKYFEKVILTK